jgi:hypothetical protein
LVNAVDLAREVAIDAAGDAAVVGDHLGSTEVDERLLTHLFACSLAGYRGWVWQVTLSRAPRAKVPTVCEAHLIPADDALLAPAWVPWAERVRPGDLEPSMVLPLVKEDPRLVPGFAETGDEDLDKLAIWELGLGRERVLGPEGREEAAARWYRGSHGPTAPSAVASTAACATCAFMVPLAGSLRGAFAVCSNEWSPSDGKVVTLDHGCGAHSQTDVEASHSEWPDASPVMDTDAHEPLDLAEPDVETPVIESEPASVAEGDAVAAEYPVAEAEGEAEPASDAEERHPEPSE